MSSQNRIERLIDLINSLEKQDRVSFARNAQTTLGNLRQIAYGNGRCSAELAIRIAKQSKYKITPHQIRPDIYPNPTDALPINVAAQLDADNVQVGAA